MPPLSEIAGSFELVLIGFVVSKSIVLKLGPWAASFRDPAGGSAAGIAFPEFCGVSQLNLYLVVVVDGRLPRMSATSVCVSGVGSEHSGSSWAWILGGARWVWAVFRPRFFYSWYGSIVWAFFQFNPNTFLVWAWLDWVFMTQQMD